MDYDAALLNSCPVEIVAEIKQMNFQSVPQANFVNSALQANASQECYNAVVSWPTLNVNAQTNSQLIGYWLGGLLDYRGTLPLDVRADLRDAFLRIGNQPEHSKWYFLVLRRHGIDIRNELKSWIVPNWAFKTLPNRPEAHTWNYFVYLASFGDAAAYEQLERRAASEASGNLALGLYDSLYELGTSEARRILEAKRADERQVFSPSGRASPLGELISVNLDLGLWQ